MNEPERNYDLLGPCGQQALQNGLASAVWYTTHVEREQLKTLAKRRDYPAIRDTIIWFAILAGSAAGGIYFWASIWCLPFWFVYGVFYGSAGDSRWHECGHGTAFKTRWMNRVVYQIASFMMMRNPVIWQFSHARHHTDTIIVGRDPEIAIMRPVKMIKLLSNFVGIADVLVAGKSMLQHATNGPDPRQKTFVSKHDWSRVSFIARIWLLIYAVTCVAALATQSWLPLMLIGLPRLYGAWHHVLTGLLQHGGLAENVTDHRLNSRTVLMNPVSRFIYWNMNYHIEHHMFPMVPYHALPSLHALIKDDLPEPCSSIGVAYREMWPVLLRQMIEPDHHIDRSLPVTE